MGACSVFIHKEAEYGSTSSQLVLHVLCSVSGCVAPNHRYTMYQHSSVLTAQLVGRIQYIKMNENPLLNV